MNNIWVVISAAMGGLGVALGAFGAHGLRPWLPLQKITIFETAVRYQLFHAGIFLIQMVTICSLPFPQAV